MSLWRILIRMSPLWASAWLASGCQEPGEHEEEPSSEATESAEVEEAEAESPTLLARFAENGDSAYPNGFAHGPHRLLRCETCHRSVQGHDSHVGTVECTDCHTVPSDFRALHEPTERECLTCHHVEHRSYSCSRCHQNREIYEPREVAATLALSVWEEPDSRSLTFEHEIHTDLECTTCHELTAYREFERGCASCHEEHHTPRSTCMSCHAPEPNPVHESEAHVGCAGSGCHQDQMVTSLPPTRSLCLTCHAEEIDHEQGRECYVCHGLGGWEGRDLDDFLRSEGTQ